jgi:hypothetical protein
MIGVSTHCWNKEDQKKKSCSHSYFHFNSYFHLFKFSLIHIFIFPLHIYIFTFIFSLLYFHFYTFAFIFSDVCSNVYILTFTVLGTTKLFWQYKKVFRSWVYRWLHARRQVLYCDTQWNSGRVNNYRRYCVFVASRASIRMGCETPVKQLKHVWCTLGLGPSVNNKEFSKKTKHLKF